MAVTGHKSASSVAVYQRVSSKEKQVMGDIITSSVRGEQPSQLSSIMPPHSTSRLQLMPPTQKSSSSTSLVQMRANTHVSSSVTNVVDILDVNYDDLFCDYNTLTTVNSVTNTRTIQQTPMFHGCTITNLNITINKSYKWKCVKVSAFKTFEVRGHTKFLLIVNILIIEIVSQTRCLVM